MFRRAAPLSKEKQSNPEKNRTESNDTGGSDGTRILNEYKPLSDGNVPIALHAVAPHQQHLKRITVSSDFEATESMYATAPNSLLTVEESVYKDALSNVVSSAFKDKSRIVDELSLEQIQLRKLLSI